MEYTADNILATRGPKQNERSVQYRWVGALVLDGLMAGLIYLWLIQGMGPVGNVTQIALWAFVALSAVSAWKVHHADLQTLSRPPGFALYHFATELALVAVLAWHGQMVLAMAFTLSSLAFELRRAATLHRLRLAAQPIATNVVELKGADGVEVALHALQTYWRMQGAALDCFDMRRCSTFKAEKAIDSQRLDVVFFHHWHPEDLYELKDIAARNPKIRFYVVLHAAENVQLTE